MPALLPVALAALLQAPQTVLKVEWPICCANKSSKLLLDAGTGWRSRDPGGLDDFRAFCCGLPQC